MVLVSSRRSFLHATRMIGRPWQKWSTSEIHCAGQLGAWIGRPTFSWTLSSESGESIAKQMRMTCESGYDSGRRRLRVSGGDSCGGAGCKHALVVLLSGGIPKRQLDLFPVHLDIGDIVLEDGRDVDLCVR